MAMVMNHGPATANGLRDLSLPRKPVQFVIEPDTFNAPPVISGGVLKKVAELYGSTGEAPTVTNAAATLEQMATAFQILLPGPDGELFVARLMSDGGPSDPPPIDLIREAVPALLYLFEAYGLRPTRPSSDSAAGSAEGTTDTTPNGGTGSTDGASAEESATTLT